MKPLSGRQFCRLFERNGWSLLRIHSSHHIYGKPGHRVRISVPAHGSAGLQYRLMKLAGIDLDEDSRA